MEEKKDLDKTDKVNINKVITKNFISLKAEITNLKKEINKLRKDIAPDESINKNHLEVLFRPPLSSFTELSIDHFLVLKRYLERNNHALYINIHSEKGNIYYLTGTGSFVNLQIKFPYLLLEMVKGSKRLFFILNDFLKQLPEDWKGNVK